SNRLDVSACFRYDDESNEWLAQILPDAHQHANRCAHPFWVNATRAPTTRRRILREDRDCVRYQTKIRRGRPSALNAPDAPGGDRPRVVPSTKRVPANSTYYSMSRIAQPMVTAKRGPSSSSNGRKSGG